MRLFFLAQQVLPRSLDACHVGHPPSESDFCVLEPIPSPMEGPWPEFVVVPGTHHFIYTNPHHNSHDSGRAAPEWEGVRGTHCGSGTRDRVYAVGWGGVPGSVLGLYVGMAAMAIVAVRNRGAWAQGGDTRRGAETWGGGGSNISPKD